MRWNSCLLIAGAVLGFGCIVIQGQRPQQEQTHFSAEDEAVKHPVTVPDEVLGILRRDRLVQNVLKGESIAPEKLLTTWFSASEITLGGPGEKDLIVEAEELLRGANIDTFWVFIDTDHGYELALTIPVHDLIVKSARTNGYRDLEALAATAVTVTTASFRFDGHEYKLFSSKTEDIK